MDPFATLGATPSFTVDMDRLERVHRDLSRALHPDKFIHVGASERAEALSRALEVNDAWRMLRDPIRRAEALFRRAGVEYGERNEPPASPQFLMQVMEQREELADAKARRDREAVARLKKDALDTRQRSEANLASGFALHEGDPEGLKTLLPELGTLRYVRRLLEDIEAFEVELDESIL